MSNQVLKAEHIARFVPHGLKVLNFCFSDLELGVVIGKVSNARQISFSAAIESKTRILLRNINTLTTKQRLEGYDEPVVQLVELAKTFYSFDVYLVLKTKNEVVLDDISLFGFDNTSFYLDNGSKCPYRLNQTKLFEWLEKHKFNAWGIPDELVEYVTEENNPYI